MPKRTLHGIDMTAPGAIEELLAHHRLTFGDAVMQDDDDTDEEDTDDTEDLDESGDEGGDGDEDGGSDDDEQDLGDKGKRALDAMKAKLKAEKAKGRTAASELAKLKAAKENEGKPAGEQAIAQAREEARAEANAKSNQRILRSEIKAAAAGKLANPSDAAKFLNLEDFDVDDDGDVDEEAIAEAISELLEQRPYLAAQSGKNGITFDSARGKPKSKKQLTQSDLKGMSPEAIAKAYDEGRVKS